MTSRFLRHTALALGVTAATLAGCGGGGNGSGVVPLLVALIRANFTPETTTVPDGVTRSVQLLVRCDREGLEHRSGRRKVRVRFDPDQRLTPGVLATILQTGEIDSEGYKYFECVAVTPDPDVRQAPLAVQVTAAAGTPAGRQVLLAYIDIEPVPGSPPRDSTLAELTLDIEAATSNFGANLLVNASFDGPVLAGSLPSTAGHWVGDLTEVVDRHDPFTFTARSGPSMLKFVSTGNTPAGSALQSSQKWQLVDVRAFAADIAAGRVRADGSVWFNRVIGDASTDRRFDLRLIAFDGDAATVPARYAAGSWLAIQAASISTAGEQWEQALANLVLPAGTTFLLVEIYAYEDVVNDTTGSEFAGHYADDASLVLTRLP